MCWYNLVLHCIAEITQKQNQKKQITLKNVNNHKCRRGYILLWHFLYKHLVTWFETKYLFILNNGVFVWEEQWMTIMIGNPILNIFELRKIDSVHVTKNNVIEHNEEAFSVCRNRKMFNYYVFCLEKLWVTEETWEIFLNWEENKNPVDIVWIFDERRKRSFCENFLIFSMFLNQITASIDMKMKWFLDKDHFHISNLKQFFV